MLAAILFAAAPVAGQTPAFEAASVKPNPGTGNKRDLTRVIEPGRITYLDATLGELIALAYGVKPYQVTGPDWIVGRSSAITFDVAATAGKAVPPAELKKMLQPLLAERFHLALHRETKELPVFLLTLAKGGPKFHDSGDGSGSALIPAAGGTISFRNWSMEKFADWLTGLPGVGRPVMDRTGLEGAWSFRANLFNVEEGKGIGDVKRAMMDGDAAATLGGTLPAQLGLRLEGGKAEIEILVIDRAEKVPTEN
jgi:uncharacterized protein (TIGR03435 family)